MTKWKKLLSRIRSLSNDMRFEELRIPKSLHRSLSEHAQREGISMNQYCIYLLSRNDVAMRS